MSGTLWEEVFNGQEFFGTEDKVYVHVVEVAPSDSRFVYALPSTTYYHHGILLVSTDRGDTWDAPGSIIDGAGASLAIDPQDPMTLYVGTWYDGVYRSRDGGFHWQAINNGLPTKWVPFLAVAVDPSNTQRIYLGVEGSVYTSANSGDHWVKLADTLSADDDVSRIAIDPQDPRNIYAAVGWSDGFRLLGWDPATVEIEGSSSKQ